jgi:hypothetical protein
LCKSIQLIVDELCPEKWSKSIFINEYIDHALSVTQINHLESPTRVSLDELSEILSLLPEVETLKISSLSFSNPTCLSEKDIEFVFCLLIENHITKVFLKKMVQIADIYFLSLISPRINHLQINFINYKHVESVVGFILTEIKTKTDCLLRVMCFCVATPDDGMGKKLEKMIKKVNLLADFMIKHAMDKIYLQWK